MNWVLTSLVNGPLTCVERCVDVALVADEDAWDGAAVGEEHLRVQVRLPLLHRPERVRPRHVEHQERAHRVLVVHPVDKNQLAEGDLAESIVRGHPLSTFTLIMGGDLPVVKRKIGCVNLLTVLWPNQNNAISQVEIESH